MRVDGIEGYKDAMKLLKEVDNKTRDKIVLSLLRKSTIPMRQAARNNIKSYSKTLAKSIQTRKVRNARHLGISVKPSGRDAYFAHFVEFGTSGIVKKDGQYQRERDNKSFVWVKKIKSGQRYRKAQAKRPFMRPAIDKTKNTTIRLLTKLFITEIKKAIDKYKKQ